MILIILQHQLNLMENILYYHQNIINHFIL